MLRIVRNVYFFNGFRTIAGVLRRLWMLPFVVLG